MNIESLILNVCELRNSYAEKFDILSQQKSEDFGQKLRQLRDIEVVSGAIYALDQVLALAEKDPMPAEDDNGMTLTKEDVEYLHEQPCFSCSYSQVDPYDWGLRCCNSDSEHCTEYCPDEVCKHYEKAKVGEK